MLGHFLTPRTKWSGCAPFVMPWLFMLIFSPSYLCLCRSNCLRLDRPAPRCQATPFSLLLQSRALPAFWDSSATPKWPQQKENEKGQPTHPNRWWSHCAHKWFSYQCKCRTCYMVHVLFTGTSMSFMVYCARLLPLLTTSTRNTEFIIKLMRLASLLPALRSTPSPWPSSAHQQNHGKWQWHLHFSIMICVHLAMSCTRSCHATAAQWQH